jgi:hypothetical protein
MTTDGPKSEESAPSSEDGGAAFDGFPPGRIPIPVVDSLSDDDLKELNSLLPWSCFIADSRGRRFGQPAERNKRGEQKRGAPNRVPDHRIELVAERLDLSELTVLEIGCFEGVHTAGIALHAKHVKACDSRVVNLAKTAVRCAMFQVHPTLFHWNVEQSLPEGQDASCDVLHHVGVLYHLLDPIGHLKRVGPLTRKALVIDTHYATEEDATQPYEVDGKVYYCRPVAEGGTANVFSGMYPTARWLKLDDLVGVLEELGFSDLDVRSRIERNGPRVTIVGTRPE